MDSFYTWLTYAALIVVGAYLFGRDSMHDMLFGMGVLIYVAIFYTGEKIARRLEAKLEHLSDKPRPGTPTPRP